MNRTINYEEFSQYLLQSIVKPEELQQMTEDLDKELGDSQWVMSEIKTVSNSVPNVQINRPQQNNGLRHEDLSQFHVADVPKLIMPDMPDSTVDVDLDNVIVTKSYAEDLRKNFVVPNSQQEQPHRALENLDLDQCASSLDELSKRLMNMKLNKTSEDFKNNDELEAELTQLCDNVNMLTQMFQSMAKLSEPNKNWSPTQFHGTAAMQYDNLINELLVGVNKVTYLLKKEQ